MPTQTNVVQSITFVLVALMIAGVLAMLHYCLIRRDQRSDPVAAGSAIRAFSSTSLKRSA